MLRVFFTCTRGINFLKQTRNSCDRLAIKDTTRGGMHIVEL